MKDIIDMTGSGNIPKAYTCCKCEQSIWNDHGWFLKNGEIICRNEVRCGLRQAAKRLEEKKAKGIFPRWRQNDKTETA